MNARDICNQGIPTGGTENKFEPCLKVNAIPSLLQKKLGKPVFDHSQRTNTRNNDYRFSMLLD